MSNYNKVKQIIEDSRNFKIPINDKEEISVFGILLNNEELLNHLYYLESKKNKLEML
jgi:hypothetical protein